MSWCEDDYAKFEAAVLALQTPDMKHIRSNRACDDRLGVMAEWQGRWVGLYRAGVLLPVLKHQTPEDLAARAVRLLVEWNNERAMG